MIRGIYISASGMLSETNRTDTIANNLANADTAGYKKDVAINKDFNSLLIQRINDGLYQPYIGRMGTGTITDEIATIHTPGSIKNTGGEFDMAIMGKGYFTVNTPAGVRYTRDGSFSLDSRGILVTREGDPVMGQGGSIRIPPQTARVDIGKDGSVYADQIEVGRLNVAQFADDRQLLKQGSNLFNPTANARREAFTGQVEQGFIERSNANVVYEMVNLIASYRAYEVNAKAVQAHDQLMDKAVNDVGRV